MDNKKITEILVSQYKASLKMLRYALEKTPDPHWNSASDNNPNWQLTYHVLWATRFYLAASPADYIPFPDAIEGAESLGGSQDWENPETGVEITGFHTREEVYAFVDETINNLQSAIEAIPLDSDSGFEWYPYSRLELHLINIRHIQHHTAQITERLKAAGVHGFPWWADQNPPQVWS